MVSGSSYLGIDPGQRGGYALLGADGTVIVCEALPDTDAELWEAMQGLAALRDTQILACLERVGASPQMGRVSIWTFARQVGAIQMALLAARIRYWEVAPARWQRALGCLSRGNKRRTLEAAQRLFPETRVTLATADALLLAEFARRTFTTY